MFDHYASLHCRRTLIGLLLLVCSLFSPGIEAREHTELAIIHSTQLPPQAQQVIAKIKQGGRFSGSRDGVVFGNYERLLPIQKRGYYHEFTVKTPGIGSRGARRIIVGGVLPGDTFYYTDDHYATFKRIIE